MPAAAELTSRRVLVTHEWLLDWAGAGRAMVSETGTAPQVV